jgi:methionine synthase II (cobalamin-independent)
VKEKGRQHAWRSYLSFTHLTRDHKASTRRTPSQTCCIVLTLANVYYLEYDTPRAGGFEPLKFLPKNKNVILGLITSKFPELENMEEMKKKVYQAAATISEGTGETKEEALNRLGVSPQCGFASHSDGNNMEKKDMVMKLQLVRKLADEIWPGQP